MGIKIGRTSLLVGLACLASGCSFVRYRGDEGERDYRVITELLGELPQSRASGMTVEQWWEKQRGKILISPVETWHEAEAALYAARSASRIRHDPYVSLPLTCLEIGFEGIGAGNIGIGGFVLFGAIISPLELITLPVWMIAGPIHEAGVSEPDLREAVRDLLRSRDLGYSSIRVEQDSLFGAPTWAYLHLDQIGYDGRWLADRE